mgnify:CR=1 FL=1
MQISEKKIHLIFVLSVLLKALNGILEIILGVLLLFTSAIAGLVQTLVKGELIEDPSDLVANTIQNFLPFLTHSEYFVAIYLLSHGVIKIFLVVGLLRNKLWAYSAAIVVFALFIVYQLYRYSFTHSIWLILLTIFDLFVIWLTWHEYRIIRQNVQKSS